MRLDRIRDTAPLGGVSRQMSKGATQGNATSSGSFAGPRGGVSRSHIAPGHHLRLRLTSGIPHDSVHRGCPLTHSISIGCKLFSEDDRSGRAVALEMPKEWGVHRRTPTRGPSHEEESRSRRRRPGCPRPGHHPDRNTPSHRWRATNDRDISHEINHLPLHRRDSNWRKSCYGRSDNQHRGDRDRRNDLSRRSTIRDGRYCNRRNSINRANRFRLLPTPRSCCLGTLIWSASKLALFRSRGFLPTHSFSFVRYPYLNLRSTSPTRTIVWVIIL